MMVSRMMSTEIHRNWKLKVGNIRNTKIEGRKFSNITLSDFVLHEINNKYWVKIGLKRIGPNGTGLINLSPF